MAAIGLPGSAPESSCSASGSTNTSTRPPESAYWSMANCAAGGSSFGCTIASTSTSASIFVAVFSS
jgi:hypothetical protein